MKTSKKLLVLLSCLLFAALSVFALHKLSERIVHYHNSFIRRFPPHAARRATSADLKFNSYYFAGISGSSIYLGNSTAPLHVLEIDTALGLRKEHRIHLLEKDLPFRSPQLRVAESHFFLFEGMDPYLFGGSTADWNGTLQWRGGTPFNQLEPMDSSRAAARFLVLSEREHVLGTTPLSAGIIPGERLNPSLLEKQEHGLFDTDGTLLYSSELQRLVYLYRYRNQFIVAGTDGTLDYRGRTIDTTATARLPLRTDRNGKTTFSGVPPTVNRLASVSGRLLYVNSKLPGRYEPDHLWKAASIIDVYDLADRSYQSSFPVYHEGSATISAFAVSGSKLYALAGNRLVSYRLMPYHKKDSIKNYEATASQRHTGPYQGSGRKPGKE